MSLVDYRNTLETIVSAVNKTNIQKYSSSEVVVRQLSLPISRSFAAEVKNKLL